MTSVRRKPYYQVIDGVPRCPLADPALLRDALNFVLHKGDLLQVSYPKSGTHWVQYIMQLILRNGEPLERYEDFSKNAGFLEYPPGPGSYEPSAPVRMLVTHIPQVKEKMNPEAKYVYVARNPWDYCVSFYHQVKDMSVYNFEDGTFDDFLDAFLEGDFGYGDYFKHVVNGYSLKNEPNVLFITYEELKKDTRGTVLKLARFMGERYGNKLENTGEEGQKLLDLIIERSAAENMRNLMTLNLAWQDKPQLSESLKKLSISSKVGHGGNNKLYSFVRRAQVGDWKENFSATQLKRMEATISKRTLGSDVMSLWSDMRQDAIRICESLE